MLFLSPDTFTSFGSHLGDPSVLDSSRKSLVLNVPGLLNVFSVSSSRITFILSEWKFLLEDG